MRAVRVDRSSGAVPTAHPGWPQLPRRQSSRQHGGAVHATARLASISTPAWRPLDAGYVAVTGSAPVC